MSAPTGWPAGLPPPGSPGWTRATVSFLFDLCPAEYRGYEVLRRHPLVLASFASRHVDAQLAAAAELVASARIQLTGQLPPEVVDAALSAAEAELPRLRERRREVQVILVTLAGRAT